jgi:hypothetical protein
MSPEKVAVLLVTALITALLATALLNAEKSEAAPRLEAAKAAAGGSPPPARRQDPLEDLTYDDLRSGRFRPAPIPRPDQDTEGPAAPPASVDYVVRRGDTARVIARRELGGERHLASIARLNPDVDLGKLKAGQVLKLPAPKPKTVLKTSGKGGEATPAARSTTSKSGATKTGAAKPAPKSAPKSSGKADPKAATKKSAPTDPKKTKAASNPGAAVKPRTV